MRATSPRTSRRFAVIDAPSNLGLRPPVEGAVPGCYKLAGALRDCQLVKRLGAEDAGCVTPPRYDRGDWQPGDGVFNAAAIATYSRRLADRFSDLLDASCFPVVLGGDCSILLGCALALNRRGRYGLAFVDGHSDFRHLGNAEHVGAAADVMPAVDSPSPGGIDDSELAALLAALVSAPRCVGIEVTVFDPDLEPDGRLARALTDTLVTAFAQAMSRSTDTPDGTSVS